jgi:hypothetical protein
MLLLPVYPALFEIQSRRFFLQRAEQSGGPLADLKIHRAVFY